MTKVIVKDSSGKAKEFYLDENTKKNLDNVKDSVLNKGWDYMTIISGIPGAGKSTFGQQIATYLNPDFSLDHICFNANDFCNKTSNAKKGECFILDESFADMNANIGRSEDFMKIMNHIQLIRQKGLFLILILPDFFSLNKNMAIFRASHLFVVYAEDYSRGRFAVFDREKKKELYVKGKQFLNYQCVQPNYRGRFVSEWLVDFNEYSKRKLEHLQEQAQGDEKKSKASQQRDYCMAYMREIKDIPTALIAEIAKMAERTTRLCIERGREEILKKYGAKENG